MGNLQTMDTIRLAVCRNDCWRCHYIYSWLKGITALRQPLSQLGRIIVTASDGEMLEVMIADADMSELYDWTPTNSAEVIAFANHVLGLTAQTATLTLTDDPAAVAPSFADDTGDAQTWEMGTAITAITVPEADGDSGADLRRRGQLASGHRL